jgi:hypothetical protein
MRKFPFILIFFLLASGCSVGYWVKVTPPGKGESERALDEMYCRKMTGKITDVFEVTTEGIKNIREVNDSYNKCLQDKGWLEYRKTTIENKSKQAGDSSKPQVKSGL